MTTRRRRLRMTIASLMVLIAALSLLILVTAPLFRLGPPPCLSPLPTARWLVARPGVAHCTDCHARPRAAVGLSAPNPSLQRTKPAATARGDIVAQLGGPGR
jgi:hypothetical protein